MLRAATPDSTSSRAFSARAGRLGRDAGDSWSLYSEFAYRSAFFVCAGRGGIPDASVALPRGGGHGPGGRKFGAVPTVVCPAVAVAWVRLMVWQLVRSHCR